MSHVVHRNAQGYCMSSEKSAPLPLWSRWFLGEPLPRGLLLGPEASARAQALPIIAVKVGGGQKRPGSPLLVWEDGATAALWLDRKPRFCSVLLTTASKQEAEVGHQKGIFISLCKERNNWGCCLQDCLARVRGVYKQEVDRGYISIIPNHITQVQWGLHITSCTTCSKNGS